MVTDHPALIIAYARPDGIKTLLNCCREIGITRIYIAIDGPKSESVEIIQAKILDLIDNFRLQSGIEIFVWHRKENLGAAVSVVTAIDWLFSKELTGYILEDDLIPSSDFFVFAAMGLEKYAINSQVWMISGSRMIPEIQNARINDWSHYPMIWGWATWSNKWVKMREAFKIPEPNSCRFFFNPRYNFWYFGSLRANMGLIDAWDVPLAFHQWVSKSYTVIPPVNLVTNVGFDSVATHTSGQSFPLNHPIKSMPNDAILEDLPSISSSMIYDSHLDKILFKIKIRHSLLRLYFKMVNLIRYGPGEKLPLSHRIASVDLPTD